MRSDSGNPLTTLVMFVPLVAVPMLAIFGVPDWFSHADASPEQRDEAPDFQLKVTGDGSSDPGSIDMSGDEVTIHGGSEGHSSHNHSNHDHSAADSWEPPGWDDDGQQVSTANQALDEHSDPFAASRTKNGGQQHNHGSIEGESYPPDLDNRPSHFREMTSTGDGGVEYASAEVNAGTDDFFDDPFASSQPSGENQPGQETQLRQSLQNSEDIPNGSVDSALDALENKQVATNDPSHSPRSRKKAPAVTWQQAIERLNAAGIFEFALQRSAHSSDYHFHCVYRAEDDISMEFRFEAEAAKPLDAVGDVVAQVVRWSRRN